MTEMYETAIVIKRVTKAIKGLKTARGIANAMHRELRKIAADFGQNPDIEVSLWAPKQLRERRIRSDSGNYYLVSWEGGPDGWAVALSLSGQIKRLMEPYYSFDLCIYPSDDGTAA